MYKRQGQHEDEQGVPFVGRAGQLLDDMLEIIHLNRTKVYIANVVKCRPPQNRDPLNVEQDACIGYLRRQAALVLSLIHISCCGGGRSAHGSGWDTRGRRR